MRGGIRKVEKNIPEVLVSSRTAVMIRARIEAIKGGGEVKKKGIRKILWGERNRMRETVVLRVSPREQYSF